MTTYQVGDVVRCRPHWPNQPAFGIWTSDTVLVTEGRKARVSGAYPGNRFTVQFDRDNDGTFYDAHWSVSGDEIVGYWSDAAGASYAEWAHNSTCERRAHGMPLDTDEWRARRGSL